MGVPEDVFWQKTPKTLQPYLKAYDKIRQRQKQDIWETGLRVREAVISAFSFEKNKTPPPYPDMPFTETEDKLVKNEKWVEKERARTYAQFMALAQASKRR